MEKKRPLKESNKWLWKKNGEMVGGRGEGGLKERPCDYALNSLIVFK